LSWVLDHAWLVLPALVALLLFGALALTRVPSGFLPSMDEGAFVVDYYLPAGTSLTDTDRVASHLEAVLGRTPEVATWSRRTGAELGPAAATLVNRGDIMVSLRRSRHRSAEEVIEALRAELGREVPEARIEFVQVLQDVINDLAGNPRPLELKLLGADPVVLRAKAAELSNLIRDVPGLVDLYEGVEGPSTELKLRIDPVAAARAGRSVADLATELDADLHGAVASVLRRPERPVGVRVRYPDATRFDEAALLRLPLLLPGGALTQLSTVARGEHVASESVLMRESLRAAVILSADHEGRDLGSVVRDVKQRLTGFTLPEGTQLELGGQYESQQETFRALARVMGFGLLLVLGVLLAQFQRARLALAVLTTVPLAVVGAVGTLWATGVPLNASSLMGGVLLVGVVVKNGILLLERYEERLGHGLLPRAALLEATQARARPILMTTLATLAGLLPLAAGIGSGAELQRPLAVAVIGGLGISTLLSLVALPALVFLTRARVALGDR
jgi:multidrug efflux pump subunit AcrB